MHQNVSVNACLKFLDLYWSVLAVFMTTGESSMPTSLLIFVSKGVIVCTKLLLFSSPTRINYIPTSSKSAVSVLPLCVQQQQIFLKLASLQGDLAMLFLETRIKEHG